MIKDRKAASTAGLTLEEMNGSSMLKMQIKDMQSEALTEKLESVRDEERRALAMEIHDVLGQALTVLKLDLAWVSRKLPRSVDPLLREKLSSMMAYIDENIQIVRDISRTSMPFEIEESGQFKFALYTYVKAFENRTGVCCRLDLKLVPNELNVDICNVLFRIFQEAMTNVARHSEATEVAVWLRMENDYVVLEIQDNGKGIPFQKINSISSIGISAMRMRAASLGGEMEILHVLEHGTCIKVQIPCQAVRLLKQA